MNRLYIGCLTIIFAVLLLGHSFAGSSINSQKLSKRLPPPIQSEPTEPVF